MTMSSFAAGLTVQGIAPSTGGFAVSLGNTSADVAGPFVCTITSTTGPFAVISLTQLVSSIWPAGPSLSLADYGCRGPVLPAGPGPAVGVGSSLIAAVNAAVVAYAVSISGGELDLGAPPNFFDPGLAFAVSCGWYAWWVAGGAALPGGQGGAVATLNGWVLGPP